MRCGEHYSRMQNKEGGRDKSSNKGIRAEAEEAEATELQHPSSVLDSGSYSQADRDYRHHHGMREGVDERAFFQKLQGL
ncbi:hypothetical protein AAG906_029585 [Vitis piasezkii]